MIFSWLLKKTGANKKLGKSLPLAIGLLAAGAFLALAVFGWGVPAETILKFLGISLVLLVGILIVSLLMVMIFRFFLNIKREK